MRKIIFAGNAEIIGCLDKMGDKSIIAFVYSLSGRCRSPRENFDTMELRDKRYEELLDIFNE